MARRKPTTEAYGDLRHQSGSVIISGRIGNAENVADLLVIATKGNEPPDFLLSWCEF